MATTATNTKVVTGIVRFSYVYVFEPKNNDGKEEYSVSLLIDKDDKETLDKINKAVEAAYKDGQSKLKGSAKSVPALAALKTPLRDGDAERPGEDAYKHKYFINAKSKTKPGLLDKRKNPIIDSTEFYSGCYGRASVNFYAYNTSGNRGIACGLNNLMKTEDGEPLGGRARAEDDFADFFDVDDDDFLG